MLMLLLVGLLLWCALSMVNSLLSGWWTLARRFRAQNEPYGDTRSVSPWFCRLRTRWGTHYNGMARLTTADDGFYVAVILPFRPGHPPLRIPWNEIAIGYKRNLLGNEVILFCGLQEKIAFRITETTAGKLGILDRMGSTSV